MIIVRTLTLILFCCFITSALAWVDSDFDGVPDKKDACKDTPANTVVMANGCIDTDIIIVDEDAEDDDEFDEAELGATITNNAALIAEQCRQQPDVNVAVDCFGSILQPVYFDFDKSNVLLTQRPTLVRVQQYIELHPQVSIRLEGHTDNIGSDAVNMTLSLKRAEAIKQLLINDYQFLPTSIEVVGMSNKKPAADNATVEGRQRNRRVEFIISAE
ncbi:OmpA family protein [Shewanella saliphila]|uniref:Membrane protein n=1 Tax=Shewanella saliphila TaxID=2282698 RepID=A0ABQ2Q6C4_9GAMM|nr:OmpA family protein [Shewanella saliphila]MCL1101303.1 OmpA family protein [Shewanella saliphila]GGP49948.1 membrane protein [Shewanella saliphila]